MAELLEEERLHEVAVAGDGHCILHSILGVLHKNGNRNYTEGGILEAGSAELSSNLSFKFTKLLLQMVKTCGAGFQEVGRRKVLEQPHG